MKYDDWVKIAGYSVIQTDRLKFDQIVIAEGRRIILVGEIAHFSYRLQNLLARRVLEARVDQMIDDLAQWAGVDSPVQKH